MNMLGSDSYSFRPIDLPGFEDEGLVSSALGPASLDGGQTIASRMARALLGFYLGPRRSLRKRNGRNPWDALVRLIFRWRGLGLEIRIGEWATLAGHPETRSIRRRGNPGRAND